MTDHWEIYALKYGARGGDARTRGESFVFDDHPNDPHGLDYFVWVLKRDDRAILVDTGFDADEAGRRGRVLDRDPSQALAALGLTAEDIDTVIVTHLHWDHAGGLHRYPNAIFHLQAAEMAYATGPCMCHGALNHVFSVEHIVEMVKHVYSGRVIFHDGEAGVAPGVTVHAVGGHSKGLQAVRAETASGPVCLASDATHFYENFMSGKVFPIVVDVEAMLSGFATIRRLAGADERVIPGHDPLVTAYYPPEGTSGFLWRLDRGRV